MRANARAELRVGDTWVLIGPGTEVVIAGLVPRPTRQKPHAQAVTLSDGRTIAEASLRCAYMRADRYERFRRELAHKLRVLFPEIARGYATAEVIRFPVESARKSMQ